MAHKVQTCCRNGRTAFKRHHETRQMPNSDINLLEEKPSYWEVNSAKSYKWSNVSQEQQFCRMPEEFVHTDTHPSHTPQD